MQTFQPSSGFFSVINTANNFITGFKTLRIQDQFQKVWKFWIKPVLFVGRTGRASLLRYMIESHLPPNFIEFITNFKYQEKHFYGQRGAATYFICGEIRKFLSRSRSVSDTYGYFEQLRKMMVIEGDFAKTIKPFIAQMNLPSKNKRERLLQNQLFISKILFVHQSLFQLQIFARNSITWEKEYY